ncbi:MAG: hypothetical protein N3A55_10520, partial [Methylohalobius sp.]|nr:hypothetical protein [Methylohalobius sp.]
MSYRGVWAIWLWFSLAWGADLEIPPSLKPWTGWALHGVEGVSCPHRFDADQPRLCAWPGPLILHAAEHGAAFRQDWQVHARSFVLLPGSFQQWPQAVTIDGQPAAVVGQENRPGLWLEPGR